MGKEVLSLIEKNARNTSIVKSDYDKNVENYDRVRFGSAGGQYVNNKEQEFVASMIKGFSVLEVGTATGRFGAFLTKKVTDYTGSPRCHWCGCSITIFLEGSVVTRPTGSIPKIRFVARMPWQTPSLASPN